MTLQIGVFLFVIALLVGVGVPLARGPGRALAVADSHASCEGIGLSPSEPGPGVQEAAGLAAFFAHERIANAEFFGTTAGAITSQDAQKHLGSQEACFSE